MSSNLSHTEVRKIAVEQADATSAPGLRLAVQVMRDMSKELGGGSPSVYKLHMNEEMRHTEGMIARQSFGGPDRIELGETEKVLLVVGATGAGKTTLINGMVNYILGVQWKDGFRFNCITEETKATQAHSQTQAITAYTFHPMKGSAVPYTFTVIDTPGYGATEGVKRDTEITKQIKEFFSLPPPHGIDHLDGVGFVVQASQPRLTCTQKYIFDSVLSIFGNDVSKNIFMMITFADGQPQPPVLEAIKEAKIPSHSEKHFKFNNSALFAKESKTKFDEACWEMCLCSFKVFFEEFPKAYPVSLRLTREVLNEREQLHVLIEDLSDQITRHLNKVEEMRQEEIVLQQHEKEIETNEQFEYTVDVTKPFVTPLKESGLHTTTCDTCFTTCHKNCPVTDDRVKHHCQAMDADGNCTECPGKCKWSVHKNRLYLIEYKTITETRTAEHLMKKYQKAVQQKAKSEQMIESINESLQNVHAKVLDIIKRVSGSLRRLDEIALKPNPVTQVEYLELLIESEKREAKPGWTQRIQYLEAVKSHAELLSKVKNEKESQKPESRDGDANEERKTSESLEKLAIGGDNFYSRFKWPETSESL